MRENFNMWKQFTAIFLIAILAVGVLQFAGTEKVSANNTPQTLPFSQNWTNVGLITADDDWSGVPGIIGYRGDDLSAMIDVDLRTVLANGSGTPVDVNANRSDPDTFATGGVTEFDGIPDPVVALQGSGTADIPHIVIHLNTTGQSNIQISYNARDIDAGVPDAAQQINTQYRVGGTGDYANVTGGYIADATNGASTATLVTPVNVTLPAAANNQSLVEVRIMTTNALGNDEQVGIDDISVTAGPVVPVRAKNVDFDGDGKSDFAIARDVTPTLSGVRNDFFSAGSVREKMRIQQETQAKEDSTESLVPGTTLQWWSYGSSNGAVEMANFGEAATDFLVPNDYDGDLQTDFAVWRPGAPTVASFYVLQSSNNVVVATPFGQTGDDTAITGDYDGDGKADYASYRCPALGSGDGQCFFYYKGSNANPGGNITYVPWGFGERFDFFVNPGDFDGDGKYDFCIQRTNPADAASGQFVLLKSSNFGAEFITWGRSSDIIVPGDYDGDGKHDFMVSRTETINGVPGRSYYLLERDGGGTGGIQPIRWGIAGDTRAPGDYDGDGKTDVAVFRPNADPAMNFFYVLRSSNGTLMQGEWGQQGDFAVASWLVH